MPTSVTTLTGVQTKSGESPRGPWLLTIFSTADGGEFSTFDGPLASRASTLLNQAVTVEWEPYEKDGRQRRTLTGVEKATEAPQAQAVPPGSFTPTVTIQNKNEQFRTKEQIMRTDALNAALTLFGVIGLDPLSSVDEFEGWFNSLYKLIEEGTFETPRIGVEA